MLSYEDLEDKIDSLKKQNKRLKEKIHNQNLLIEQLKKVIKICERVLK